MANKKSVVFEPFKNPYADNAYLDSDSVCSEDFSIDLDTLDLSGLMDMEQQLRENISDWEDIIYDDMQTYSDSSYESESARSDLKSDRRALQTLKVELREVKKRIRMMKKIGSEVIAA